MQGVVYEHLLDAAPERTSGVVYDHFTAPVPYYAPLSAARPHILVLAFRIVGDTVVAPLSAARPHIVKPRVLTAGQLAFGRLSPQKPHILVSFLV
jgi:hypothetical protein